MNKYMQHTRQSVVRRAFSMAVTTVNTSLSRGIILLLVLLFSASAQVRELPLKAMFLEAAVRFVTWPADDTTAPSDYRPVFTIGFFSKDAFSRQLTKLTARKKIKRKQVRFVNIDNLAMVDSCDMVLIPASRKKLADRILSRIRDKAILTVSDDASMAEYGIIINIGIEKQKISCRINKDRASAAGFSISHHLLRKSTIVSTGKNSQ